MHNRSPSIAQRTAPAGITTADEPSGLIRVRVTGAVSAEAVERHCAALAATLAAVRARGVVPRVLIDVTGSAAQPPETLARFRAAKTRACRPGDRIALLVRSCLIKAQLRRALGPEDQLFVSRNAAETWLLAGA